MPTPRQLLLHSWAGRLFIVSAAVKLLVGVLRLAVALPVFVRVVSSVATVGLAISVGYFAWRLFIAVKRQLLWRVRRKLILSYIFFGVIPALLIVGFFLIGAMVVAMSASAYVFRNGYDKIVDDVGLIAQAAAVEIARRPEGYSDTMQRVAQSGRQRYPGVSMAFVPTKRPAEPDGHKEAKGPQTPPAPKLEFVRVGRWDHEQPPTVVPEWVIDKDWTGGTVVKDPTDAPGEIELVARGVAAVRIGGRLAGHVIADQPIDTEVLNQLQDKTTIRVGSVSITQPEARAPQATQGVAPAGNLALFRNSVSVLTGRDWTTGSERSATIGLMYRTGALYDQLAKAQGVTILSKSLGEAMLIFLVVVAVLFLIIQGVALVMGLALARSITSSIHELFMGTERVRHGDFAHRINIPTKDQLGELAQSFNQMTASIEGLLQTAAEKKRLEEELRIARQIQMSLLPRGPLDVPGLAITALCVPAREVGGDYYDFFPLSDDRLGVLIADVSGKGTSAALYMAELKGVVLALSQRYDSPRQLLIEVNRIISENLDSRSFITVTYAVIDTRRGVMTYCRAGHTPLIYLPSGAVSPQLAQVLTPSGMVLGLRIDGAAEKFSDLLEEDRIDLSTGDVIVFYTDGITEAMNAESDLFGEPRLSRIVEEHGHLESGELRERILREIESFVGGADQHDDMTMILLKVEPAFVGSERIAV
jgi:sigma-B regulation protein RsbU (phosphoserine phosphatase)